MPVSVLQSQGSVLTNKYAEGYPGRRYYGGCEEVDVAEELAIERAKSLFGADVRERPAALRCDRERRGAARDRAPRRHAARSLARPGRPPDARHEDQLLGPALQHRRVRRRPRDVDHRHGRGAPPRDRAQAEGHHRRLVGLPAPARLRGASARSPTRSARCCGSTWRTSPGWSPPACTRTRCRTRTSSPRPCTRRSADPRSGFILTNDAEIAKKINTAVFPGQQGGPLMHVIAAKATAFKLAATPEFKERQERVLSGAHIIAERLSQQDVKDAGIAVRSGGTDVHLVLVDLRDAAIDGKQAEDLLHEIHITVNRNAVPNDPRPPMVTSGLRIGTPALATRGFGDARVPRGRRHHRARAAAGCGRRGSARTRRRPDRGVPALSRARAVVRRPVRLQRVLETAVISRSLELRSEVSRSRQRLPQAYTYGASVM